MCIINGGEAWFCFPVGSVWAVISAVQGGSSLSRFMASAEEISLNAGHLRSSAMWKRERSYNRFRINLCCSLNQCFFAFCRCLKAVYWFWIECFWYYQWLMYEAFLRFRVYCREAKTKMRGNWLTRGCQLTARENSDACRTNEIFAVNMDRCG